MALTRREFLGGAAVFMATAMAGGLVGCGSLGSTSSSSTGNTATTESVDLSADKWSYDATNNVYYQIGVPYCSAPVTTDYESMGIYVPGAYFKGTANSDGTYSCSIDTSGTVNGFTAQTAPIVLPINTAGYSAQAAPTSYSYDGLGDYLEAGFVYVFAGCRGRANGTDSSGNFSYSGGAPWGVTDLKSAVRTLRYNSSKIPGSMDRIISFGMSGGGAQSAVLGATGDADGYASYLEKIGAPLTNADGSALSDAIFASMCWCPITNLDYASEAYEWNMGQFSTSDTRADGTFTKAMSTDMAAAWAAYLNKLGLKNNNTTLTLEESSDGTYLKGSYYDYLVSVIQDSLNNFLADTEFPYTPNTQTQADLGAGGGGQGAPSGSAPSGSAPSGSAPSGAPSGSAPTSTDSTASSSSSSSSSTAAAGAAPSGAAPTDAGSSDSSSSTTYDTVEDYIDALNGDDAWIDYDSDTNTATVKSLSGFVTACKSPSKAVGAFDAFDRSQAENQLFGNDDNDYLHFDYTMSQLLADNQSKYSALSNWNSSYPSDFANDLKLKDDLGNASQARQNLYNPLYYLLDFYDGAGSSTPAEHWRIRTGINQGDTANTTEVNLALALQMSNKVKDVDFATVWGLGHTTAERTGSATDNFISWVEGLCK